MNLVVDYGNSSAKVGIFEKHQLIQKHALTDVDQLKTLLSTTHANNMIVSSVSRDAKEISEWAVHTQNKFILTSTLPLPIKNAYATPATLGVDRIAGVCGAHQLYPNQPALVIDAGTCVTYDFIDETGLYSGGAISPGLTMRFQAMHTLTAKLPLVKPVANPPLTGNSTETSMQSGVIFGMIKEIEGIISLYEQKYPDLRVILCGGDALFFENKLKASIFAVPELVLIGLNSILIRNVLR
jgi:type III pantothenate kinase